MEVLLSGSLCSFHCDVSKFRKVRRDGTFSVLKFIGFSLHTVLMKFPFYGKYPKTQLQQYRKQNWQIYLVGFTVKILLLMKWHD